MAYAVWNPVPWCLFLAGLLLCVLSVSIFHKKYPHYPWGISSEGLQARDVMLPAASVPREISSNLKWRVNGSTPLVEAERLLAFGAPFVGVESADGIEGVIGPDQIPAHNTMRPIRGAFVTSLTETGSE